MFVKSFILCLLTAATLAAAPQAIIFDFGGVMTGEQNREAVVQFLCESFHLSRKEFITLKSKKSEAIKNGMTDIEFWLAYAKERKISLPVDWACQFQEVMKQAINPNQAMYTLVDELKQNNLQVGLLSNIDTRLANLVRGFGLYRPFHLCLLSCDIGVEKPNERAYKILLSALNLSPGNVVFIDDKQENIDAAKNLGIDAIQFESDVQIRHELEQRGLLCDSTVVF